MRIEARLRAAEEAAEEAAEAARKDYQSTMPKIKWGDWDWDWDDRTGRLSE